MIRNYQNPFCGVRNCEVFVFSGSVVGVSAYFFLLSAQQIWQAMNCGFWLEFRLSKCCKGWFLKSHCKGWKDGKCQCFEKENHLPIIQCSLIMILWLILQLHRYLYLLDKNLDPFPVVFIWCQKMSTWKTSSGSLGDFFLEDAHPSRDWFSILMTRVFP